MEWQPIESAPRDGTWFVIANFASDDPEFEVGCYDPQLWASYVEVWDGLYRKETQPINDWRGFNNFHRATHWTLLPDAPPHTS